ncbi:MAG: hydroxymethylglutaryl-CoA synthase [Polyangiaceae bacterium]|jgi:hydroxymethylglutaryl-CoA synthase|nr:hydroxymethylglutaryl-CoA synthase [Polyangiaceae bacterium]
MTHTVGIEALGVALPSTYLELEALAQARGVPPGKYIDGLGTTRMAVPLPDEDTVTLAAQAARMALESAGASPESIGLLAVGTETAVDHSKPVSSYVQGLLGVGRHCRVFETKHACYGGTAALQLAVDWVRSGSARGRKALIVCSDIARYGIGTAGEPTQGAGAVALLVSDEPKILELDAGLSGVWSNDVHDFWRPLYSKDALVDGHYSVRCYLDALGGAYAHYKELAGAPGVPFFSERFAALAYHVPYGKMARKAHRHLRAVDGDQDADASFDRLVGPSLILPAQAGNLYTGSLYLALASLLTCSPRPLDGARIGLFSYGSGSCAEFFSGTVNPGAQARVRSLGLPALFEGRRSLSVDEYEEIMRARDAAHDERPFAELPRDTDYHFLGVREHRRTYSAPALPIAALDDPRASGPRLRELRSPEPPALALPPGPEGGLVAANRP